jgi:hypothetical protein
MKYEDAKRIHDITPNEFHYLIGLRNGIENPRLKLLCNIRSLQDRGLLTEDNVPDGDSLLFVHDSPVEVIKLPIEEFCDRYYALFPMGVKSGGYPVRDGLTNTIKKMTAFRKEYPDYSDDDIIGATKKYIADKKKEGYSFMKLASHLIYKDRMSSLAGLVEAYKENGGREEVKQGFGKIL